jgi:uncharacterized protein YggE
MRRACIGVGLLLVASFGVALFAPQTHGQPAPGGAAADTHRKITVTGVGTVAVKPDTARVSFAVKGTGADFKAAVADCDKKAEAVKKAVADLKLGGLEVKFGPINLLASTGGIGGGGPAGGFGSAPGGGIGGFGSLSGHGGGIQGVPGGPGGPGPMGRPVFSVEVTRTFTVVASFGGKESAGELKDIVSVADKTLMAAMLAGATEPPVFNSNNGSFGGQLGFGGGGFNGGGMGNSRIEFSRSSYNGLRQDALKLAVADAVTSAKAAAGVANLTAKDIVGLSDQVQFNGFGPVGLPTNSGRGEVLGEQELTVQVIVTFSY